MTLKRQRRIPVVLPSTPVAAKACRLPQDAAIRFGRVRHAAGTLLDEWYSLRTLPRKQVRHAHQP